MKLRVLRTLLSGLKLPFAAALWRAVVNHKGGAQLFVVYCSQLR